MSLITSLLAVALLTLSAVALGLRRKVAELRETLRRVETRLIEERVKVASFNESALEAEAKLWAVKKAFKDLTKRFEQ